MNSEKVKEIKKALECNATDKHDNLSYIDENDKCQLMPFADILTLINELESENKRLKWEKQTLEDKDTLLAKVGELSQENQQLKDRIAELEKGNENLKKQFIAIDTLDETNFEKRHNAIVFITEKQLKQFAERLKEKMGVREYMGVKYKQGVFSENDIDETLNEFIKN